jgi:hypothetical protein
MPVEVHSFGTGDTKAMLELLAALAIDRRNDSYEEDHQGGSTDGHA